MKYETREKEIPFIITALEFSTAMLAAVIVIAAANFSGLVPNPLHLMQTDTQSQSPTP
jgi:hypothetical protein